MKINYIILFLFCLLGCDVLQSPNQGPPKQTFVEQELIGIKGLEDCIYVPVKITEAGMSHYLRVIRCPNSSTSVKYNCGKNCTREISAVEETKDMGLNCKK